MMVSSRPDALTTGVSLWWNRRHATAIVATIPRHEITAGAIANALFHLM